MTTDEQVKTVIDIIIQKFKEDEKYDAVYFDHETFGITDVVIDGHVNLEDLAKAIVEALNTAKGLVMPNDGKWIGVDWDGTLVESMDFSPDPTVMGKPIPLMVERVKGWLAEGKQVRIVTARVMSHWFDALIKATKLSPKLFGIDPADYKYSEEVRQVIGDRTLEIFGVRLIVQCEKHYKMTQLWDDIAIQMVENTGRTLAEEHTAALLAEQSKHQGPRSE